MELSTVIIFHLFHCFVWGMWGKVICHNGLQVLWSRRMILKEMYSQNCTWGAWSAPAPDEKFLDFKFEPNAKMGGDFNANFCNQRVDCVRLYFPKMTIRISSITFHFYIKKWSLVLAPWIQRTCELLITNRMWQKWYYVTLMLGHDRWFKQLNGFGVLFGSNVNIVKLDGGDGCTTLWLYTNFTSPENNNFLKVALVSNL